MKKIIEFFRNLFQKMLLSSEHSDYNPKFEKISNQLSQVIELQRWLDDNNCENKEELFDKVKNLPFDDIPSLQDTDIEDLRDYLNAKEEHLWYHLDRILD